MAIPIWDRNTAELSRAKAERRLAQRNLDALREKNLLAVLASAREHARARQASAIKYQNDIIPAWRDVLSVMDKKFENGQVSVFELYQMRERITEVHHEFFQTYLMAIEAQIELESLIGQSLNDMEN
jgi:outer membrane protein TolC